MARKSNAAPADPLASLNAMATGNPDQKKNGKNGSKVVVIDPEPVASQVEAWADAKRQISESEAVKEQAEIAIREYAEPLWKDGCKREGSVKHSASVGIVNIAWKSGSQMFSRGSLDLAAVRTVLGADFEKYFKVIDGPYQLLDDATKDIDFIKELVVLVQKFKAKTGLVYLSKQDKCEPKDSLYDLRCLDPETFTEVDGKLKAVGVQDQKPSFSAR
jgi:hypothetical protein